MNEGSNWLGKFDVFVKTEQDDDWKHEKTINNTIMDAGLNLLRDSIYNSTSAEIKYIAVGTSSATISTSQTQLGSEIFRKPIYSRTQTGTGSVQTIAVLFESEAVAQIEEIGVFAGSTASSTTNSGVMISRILYSRNKSNLESLQIQRTDTIGRG